MNDCVVIGAGVAGLAAATALADRGMRVTVLEGRSRTGGRTISYSDPLSGCTIDNGQHLLAGCYRASLRYLDRIGSTGRLTRATRLRLPFAHADGRRAMLAAPPLPYPLSLAGAFLRFRFLTVREKARLFHVARALRASARDADLDAVTAADWLQGHGQSDNAVRSLWRPVILATMNAEPEHASAALTARVLRMLFLDGRDGSHFLMPAAGLSSVFADPAVDLLERRGVRVHVRAPASALAREADGSWTVRMKGGAGISARSVLAAIPAPALRALLAASGFPDAVPGLARFEPSPIVSVHVWTRAPIDARPMIGLLGTDLQWLFQKGRCRDGTFHATCTISAADAFSGMDNAGIERRVTAELRQVFRGMTADNVLRVVPLRERAATFRPLPGMERSRPGPATVLPGLVLAGDWTATGLPATIESAALSAERASDTVIGYLQEHGGNFSAQTSVTRE